MDERYRQAVMTACRHDFLFFLSAFCWVYEPRPRKGKDGRLLPKQLPFIPWNNQVPVIKGIVENIGIRDIGVEKARGEGMSWILVLLALWFWLFDKEAKVGLVSSTEKKADDPGNMDSLMAKIDWEIQKLPQWMTGIKDKDWSRNLSDHSLVHHRTKCQINAFSATGGAGRGGRYTWFGMDELSEWDNAKAKKLMASTQQATQSRLVVATPLGNEGEYYRFMHQPSNALKLILDWKENQTRNRGLYRFKDGVPVALDPIRNPLPKNYDPPTQPILDMFSRLRAKGFKMTGVRSPWYDNECDRADSTPQSIAAELDRDYGGSMSRVLTNDFFEVAQLHIRPPIHEGNMDYHPETLEPSFGPAEGGFFKVWMELDSGYNPPPHAYVVACDVSTGLGGSYTSNSTIEAFDLVTGEQVVEAAANTIDENDWADLAIATCKWLGGAYLAWEQNGPGEGFGKQVRRRKYTNFYYRTVHWKSTKNRKTKEPGWWTDGRTIKWMFAEIKRAVKSGEAIIHSAALLRELGQYVYINGEIVHVGASRSDDDAAKGKAHGDRVIGMGVCLQAMEDRPLAKAETEAAEREPPRNTLAWRQKLYEQYLQEQADEWDSRTNADLAHGASIIPAGLRRAA